MNTTRQSPAARSLADWLREIHAEQKTGKLEVPIEDEVRELYFLSGELYLAPEHPAYEAARSWVAENREAGGETEEGEHPPARMNGDRVSTPFRQLTGPIIGVSGGSEPRESSFVSGAGQIRLDLVGPLPTHQLVMECAVWGADEPALWRQLGGEEMLLRAGVGLEETMANIEIEPQEAFLLSRLDPPAKLGELISQLDLGRDQVLRSLCRLQAIGLVEKLEDGPASGSSQGPKDQLIDRFAESVAASLAEEPLDIDPEKHRERLAELLGRVGEMTHFDLLEVSTQSGEAEVHKAYLELARLVHPKNAGALGLTGKEGAFRVLFERATDAYLTLSDPARKVEYLQEMGPSTQSVKTGPSGAARDHERQEMARGHYERALVMADRQDFHTAIQLMEQAVNVDPKFEYLTLLGDCQAENPQWLERAVESYQAALNQRDGDPSVYSRLGRVFERLGRKDEALQAYEAALAVAPQLESARAGLWRLGGGHPVDAEKPSLVNRLRRILKV